MPRTSSEQPLVVRRRVRGAPGATLGDGAPPARSAGRLTPAAEPTRPIQPAPQARPNLMIHTAPGATRGRQVGDDDGRQGSGGGEQRDGAAQRRGPHPPHVDVLAPERERLRGDRPGDRLVRLRRPKVQGVRRLEAGVYEVVANTPPAGAAGRLLHSLGRWLIGAPIRTEHELHERLPKKVGLAAFGTDNISSSAYASEELMRVLALAGGGALALTMPLSLAVVALLAIVVVSYQQTIRAYPRGGGSYVVASDNLGTVPGLIAGASILVDYVLTVAVSASAGTAAITSAFPALHDERALIAVGAVAVIAWMNLRGIRESGTAFAAPLYLYVLFFLGLIAYGLYRFATGDAPPYASLPLNGSHGYRTGAAGAEALGLFLVLRAFASGSVGLTGTEAIADGVAAFKPPESRNARITLVVMASIFATVFLGISFLSGWIGIQPDPNEAETVNSQLTRALIGTGWLYYAIQLTTAVLLVLAANTAFADFPRLASFMSRDKFLPSHFAIRGGRLAFSNGILALALVAAGLILLFQGSVTSLIPLYTVGVFLAFTLSQCGLVARWWRLRAQGESGWQWRMAVNATGAAVTAVVAVVVGATKFALGAWVVLVLIPVLVLGLLGIRRHYHDVADQVAVDPNDAREHPDTVAAQLAHYLLIPVKDLDRTALRAIAYARSLTGGLHGGPDSVGPGGSRVVTQAVHVTDDTGAAAALQRKWERYEPGVELVVVESPYRTFIGPLLRYIDAVERHHAENTAVVTVLLPEFVPAHWWEHVLHTHTALQIKGALLFRPRVAVTSVPYHLQG
ncbi:MAG TPA: APC family permease [Chloroflexota bacterium]|nr:APC family permease [Chloroflexota bacterium]